MHNLFAPRGVLRPLRWYQEDAIPKFREALRQGFKRPIGQAPCGWGKTVLAAHLLDSALKKGSRCLFACPRISLVEQTLAAFESQGIHDIGIMQGNHRRTDRTARVQIACFDTLYSRPVPEFDLVIIDEVHMCDARMWKLMEKWKIVLGLTATPWTKGLGIHFDKLLLFSTIEEMIGYNAIDSTVGLVPTIGKGPNWALLNGLSGIKKSDDGEFAENAAAIFMDRNEIVADVVETWLKTRQDGSHPGDRTFLFCPKRANALALQQAFGAQGIKFGYIDALTSERTPILKQFRSKEIAGIASVGCLSVGVDEDVRCVIDAALSNSPAAIVQKLMRGSRPGEGKKYLWLNDHTGNSNRFGWFEHIIHDKLDDTPPHIPGGPYQKEDAAPRKEQRRECSVCRSILPRGAMRCNVCGLQLVFDDIEVIPGELTDLKKGPKKEPKPKKDDKQAFYSGLIDYCQRRGFKEGWAANQYRAKFGVWPRGLEAVPMTPRKAVKEFIEESRKKYLAQKAQA